MMSRAIGAVMVFAMFATACGSDAETEEIITVDVNDVDTLSTRESWCLHRTDVFLVSIADAGPIANPTLQIDGAQRLDEEAIKGLLDEAVADLAGDVADLVAVYELTSGVDLRSAVDHLRGEGVDAAPVLAWGLTGHWAFAPADEAKPATSATIGDVASPASALAVAVLDTGLIEDRTRPAWLRDHVSAADSSIDAEEPNLPLPLRGHGVFVASILRQQHPETAVTVFRIPATSAERFDGAEGELTVTDGVIDLGQGPRFASDELQVLATFARVAAADAAWAGVNISGGSYECQLEQSASGAIGLRAAVDLLEADDPDTVIAAAAGNDAAPGLIPPTMLPAGFDDVVGVAAIDPSGTATEFSNPGDVVAPGLRLVGVIDGEDPVAWSGTSFATPLWLAHHLANGSPDDVDPVDSAVPFEP